MNPDSAKEDTPVSSPVKGFRHTQSYRKKLVNGKVNSTQSAKKVNITGTSQKSFRVMSAENRPSTDRSSDSSTCLLYVGRLAQGTSEDDLVWSHLSVFLYVIVKQKISSMIQTNGLREFVSIRLSNDPPKNKQDTILLSIEFLQDLGITKEEDPDQLLVGLIIIETVKNKNGRQRMTTSGRV